MTDELRNPRTLTIADIFGQNCRVREDHLLGYAKACIEERFSHGEVLDSSVTTRNYIKLLLGHYEREMFYVVWLNNKNQVIKHGILFQGTIDNAAVHPREIVKDALSCNAAACIFAHNHPSGSSEPSQADIGITRRLKTALALVDIRTLDHIVVGDSTTSMAELGLM
jgi:DNA repair protein RadC